MKEDSLLFEDLENGNKDAKWFSKQYSNLKKEYAKKFVAIKNQGVILAENNLDTLIENLRKKHKDPNDYLIDFIPDDTFVLVV